MRLVYLGTVVIIHWIEYPSTAVVIVVMPRRSSKIQQVLPTTDVPSVAEEILKYTIDNQLLDAHVVTFYGYDCH
jgi:hypothetical protein